MVVYTANFGGYDRLRSTPFKDVEHILFTDEDVQVAGWKTIIVDRMFNNPARENRYYKLQPHLLFPNQQTLYLDASMSLKTHPERLLEWFRQQTTPDADLYAIRHPLGHTLPMEFAWLREKGIVDEKLLSEMEKRYNSVPKNSVGIEARLLINTGNTINFFNTWWNEVKNYAHRDQPSFHYAKHETKPSIATLPMKQVRPHFNIYPHKKTQLQGAS